MGQDKGALIYEDFTRLEQRRRLHALLTDLGLTTFLSCRPEQASAVADLPSVLDIAGLRGPTAGLLAAHRQDQSAAWLVVACDFPFLERADFERLIHERNPTCGVTAYVNLDQIAEPLFAIWEPEALRALAAAASQVGETIGPKQILQKLEWASVAPRTERVVVNVNSPQEIERWGLRVRAGAPDV